MKKKEEKRKTKWWNIALPIITPIVALAIATPILLKCSGNNQTTTYHTITYDDGYDSTAPVITTQKVENNTKASMLLPEHRDGKGFIGWKTVKGNDSAPYFDFMNTPITSDLKLYGYWKREATPDEAFIYKTVDTGVYIKCNTEYCHTNNIVDIVVPTTIDNKPVVGIDEGAFTEIGETKTIRSISLPNSVKEFSGWSFDGCSQLRILNIPENLKIIGQRALSGCCKLADIKLNEGLEIIADEAFTGEEAGSAFSFIKTLTLPSTLKYIGFQAFYMNSVQKLDMSKCKDLILAPYAFSFAINLIEVQLPPNLPYIPASCFDHCTRLRYVTIPKTVKYIDSGAFESCYRIRQVKIAEDSELLSIESRAFNCNESLESINFPKTLKSIAQGAFTYTFNLNSVSFEKEQTWYYTSNLGVKKQFKTDLKDTSLNAQNLKLWVQETEAQQDGCNLTIKPLVQNNIEYLTDDNNQCVVTGCTSDFSSSSLVIPAKIIETTGNETHEYKVIGIGRNAFRDKTSITSVTFQPDAETNEIYLQYILDNAFYDCKFINSINLNLCTNLNYIGSRAFARAIMWQGTQKTVDLDLSNTVITHIGDSAFDNDGADSGCNGALKDVTLPSTLEYLGNAAFHDQKNIEKFEFAVDTETQQSNLKTIGSYKDYVGFCNSVVNSTKLTKIDLSKCVNMTYLPRSVFEGNTALTTLTLPANLVSIYEYAFKDCSSLANIKIPQYCTYIKYNSFENCPLTSAIFDNDKNTNWLAYKGESPTTITVNAGEDDTKWASENATKINDHYDYTWIKEII